MASIYDDLFLEKQKTQRLIGTIVALSSYSYSVELVFGGGVIQVRGTGFNTGDKVLIENGTIVQKLDNNLELVEIVI